MPVAGTQDDRDHDRVARLVPFHRPFQLNLVTIVRREEVRADQQQDDVVSLDMAVDFGGEILARLNPPVVPRLDDTLPLQ